VAWKRRGDGARVLGPTGSVWGVLVREAQICDSPLTAVFGPIARSGAEGQKLQEREDKEEAKGSSRGKGNTQRLDKRYIPLVFLLGTIGDFYTNRLALSDAKLG